MLAPLDALPESELQTAICIVGGGPAGITLARDLAERGHDVVLCEGGGLDLVWDSQVCYDGETVGDEYYYLTDARLRFFGGTSNHWTGVCADFDDADFAPKAAAPLTGWPIGPGELRPYIDRARGELGLPPAAAKVPVLGGDFERIDVRQTVPPRRFGKYYQPELERSERIRTILDANLVDMRRSGGALTALVFRSYSGRELTVRAARFVIACGGIENARLLLHLNAVNAVRFGGPTLGGYFTEHPHAELGEYVLFDTHALAFADMPGIPSVDNSGHLQVSKAFQEAHGTLGFRFRLRRYRSTGATGLAQQLLCVAPALGRRIAGALDRKLLCAGRLSSVVEQEPVPENRVALGDSTDAFGIPRTVLHWRWSELDRHTAREATRSFAAAMADNDLGRVRMADWILDESLPVETPSWLAAYHHMGTTRMGVTERDGTVDVNCRVFGTANLYMAGSSVFPSGGHANPTVPLMGLALRLSEHLDSRLN